VVLGLRCKISPGDRIRLFGGYEMEPRWLGGRDQVLGVVERFIPGQNEPPAAVVRLDETLAVGEARGDVVVLELAWEGTDWATRRPRLHVELCDFDPEPRRWQGRRQGAWVESHATYDIVRRSRRRH
jgi:hypothetical protein